MFDLTRKHLAMVGIESDRANRNYALRRLFVASALSTACVSGIANAFYLRDDLELYIDLFVACSTSASNLADFAVFVWKTPRITALIDYFEELIEKSELDSQFSLLKNFNL